MSGRHRRAVDRSGMRRADRRHLGAVLGVLLMLLSGSIRPLSAQIPTQRLPPPQDTMIVVPDAVGVTVPLALRRLIGAGLRPERLDSVASDAPEGTVVGQSPAAGSRVSRGTGAVLTVAAAARGVRVPDVVGHPVRAAAAMLQRSGLVMGEVRERPLEDARPGTVLAQTPAAGAEARSGAPVHLTVGVPPPTPDGMRMPGVVGLPLDRGVAVLREAGLRLEAVDSVPRVGGEGTIIEQKPAAGEAVAPGSGVSLALAIPALARVPDLTGMQLADAERVLARLQLGIEALDQAEDPAPANTVLRQVPGPGSLVQLPAGVRLVVAQALPIPPAALDSAVVPDLRGRTLVEAASELRAARLEVGPVDSLVLDSAAAVVVAQAPPANASVAVGTAVQLSLRRAVPAMVEVPDVVGLSASAAEAVLTAAGLRFTVPAPTADADAVLSQIPAAGTLVAAQTVVTVQFTAPVAPPGGFSAWIVAIPVGVLVLAALAGFLLRSRHRRAGQRPIRTVRPPPEFRPGTDLGVQSVRLSGPLYAGPALRLRPRPDPGTQSVRCGGTLLLREEVHDD